MAPETRSDHDASFSDEVSQLADTCQSVSARCQSVSARCQNGNVDSVDSVITLEPADLLNGTGVGGSPPAAKRSALVREIATIPSNGEEETEVAGASD